MSVTITSTSSSNLAKVGFGAYTTTGTIGASATPIAFSTAYVDSASGWNGNTTYTIPRTGTYTVTTSITVSPATVNTGSCFIAIAQNGTAITGAGSAFGMPMGTQVYTGSVTITAPFTVGDTITMLSNQNAAVTTSIIEAVISLTSINAATGTGGGGGPVSPVVAAYTRNANLSITTTDSKVIWDTLVFDTNSMGNTSNGIFTAPTTGYYRISAGIYLNPNTGTAGGYLVLYVNSSFLYRIVERAVSTGYEMNGTVLVALGAGDTFYIAANSGSGTSTMINSSPFNYVMIEQVH